MAIRFDISKDKAAIRRMAAEVVAEMRSLLVSQAPKILAAVQNVTPPANGRTKLGAAIHRGRRRVQGDVYKVVRPSSEDQAENVDLATLMRTHRVKGRVPAKISPRHRLPMSVIQPYIRQRQARVGDLARAWQIKIVQLRNGVRVKVINRTPYAESVQGLQARVNKVMQREQRRLMNRMPAMVRRAAARAGHVI